jgi:tRNA dimethylallyltransferase
MVDDPPIPILVGPTGVGKSEVAYQLAKKLNSEILSADAFQVYKGLEVGTAQPSKEWQKEVSHHLVGIRDPRQGWNAVEFAREAMPIIEGAKQSGKKLFLVGGAGFYIRALVEGPPPGKAPKPEVRSWILSRVRELGPEKAHQWLKERDSEAATRLHPNDNQRVCRALEKTFETDTEETSIKPLGSSSVLFLGLERSRDKLDSILSARTQSMWKNGLLDEAKRLSGMSLPPDHPIWGAIGYQEAVAFLKGEMKEADALGRIYRRTRQYAKRQWTWFKHQHDVRWLNLDGYSNLNNAASELAKLISAER